MAAGRLVVPPWFPARNRSGTLVPGALLAVYVNETAATKADIFSDEALTTPLANPVEANSSGVFPAIWAEAGTADVPVLYRVSLSGPDGESIVNPSAFDNWQPSLDAETAQTAIASAASDAAVAALADVLAVQALGDDAAAIAARAAKSANGSDFSDKAAVTDNLLIDDGQSGAVDRSVGAWIRDLPINAATYGFVPGTTDKGAELLAAVNAAIASGRELYIPAGAYRVDTGVRALLTDALSYKASFRKGLRIRGAGSGRTIIDSRVASGWLLDITVGNGSGGESTFASFAGILGGYVEGLTIRNGAATTASNGIRVRAQYQFRLRDLHIVGLSGVGIKGRCAEGDLDATNMVHLDDVRIEDCGGWGADLGTDDGHNENSFTVLDRVFIQNCGTAEQKAITGISKASPGVVTCVGHGFTTGQRVFIGGCAGMTEVNSYTAETSYTVTVLTADTFSIGVNTTGYTTWTSGGYAFPRTPSSGGLRLKGQIAEIRNSGWTINKNRSVWIDGEDGLPQDVFFYNSTIENPQLIGLHVQGNRTLLASGLHVYTNAAQAAGPTYWGHLYDGETNVVSDIEVRGGCVRTTSASGEADLHVFHGFGVNYYRDTVQVSAQSMHVKQFGHGSQVMFKGVNSPAIPQQCTLTVTSGSEVRLRPDPVTASGNKMPLRVSYGGASGAQYTSGGWIAARIPNAGIAISNAGLAASTTYYAYLYAANSTLMTPTLELSTTAPVLDTGGTGYLVKTGDATRLCIANSQGVPTRVRTDASGTPLFITTDSGFLDPIAIGGEAVGTRGLLWYSSADRKLRVKTNNALPTSAAAGTYDYWPTLETSVAYDPPELVAGATTTVDVTVVCGAGDYCSGVGFSAGWGGLTATGCVKAANTVTVTVTNNTAGTIDLASGSLRVAIQRR